MPAMIGGVSPQEFGFVAVLIFLVLFAPVAPKIGEVIGGLFEKPDLKGKRGNRL
jgi:hypothetical protein